MVTASEITGYLPQRGRGEDVVIVNAECFAQLLAQIGQLLQTLLDLLLPLGNVLGHSSFVFPDAGSAFRFIELYLCWKKKKKAPLATTNTL